MPTAEECTERRIEVALLSAKVDQLTQRIDAISERLDENIEQAKAINKWLSTYGTIVLLIALLGDKAIPLLTKILGAT